MANQKKGKKSWRNGTKCVVYLIVDLPSITADYYMPH